MEMQMIFVFCVALCVKYSEAAITGWTTPAGAVGTTAATATHSADVPEGSAAGTAVLTVVATTGATSITSYALTSSTPSGAYFAVSSTGVVTVGTAGLDYEPVANRVHILTITATDDGGATGTLDLTINIGDVNDNAPTFSATEYLTSTPDRTCTATQIYSLGASVTDADVTPAYKVTTYSISSGNGAGRFTIGSSTGVVSVAKGKKLKYEDAESYALVIKATDSDTPALTGTTTLMVYICSAPSISVSILTLFVGLLASLR